MKKAEAELGEIPMGDFKKTPWPHTDDSFDFKLLQSGANINREPLLSANASELEIHETPAYSTYAVDYKVPDFGVSHEIRYTNNNMKNAEAKLGAIPMGDFKKTPWPHTDTTVDFKLLQSEADIHREPLLSANASELEVHQRPAYSDHPIDYPVPDFGISHEIRYTNNNIKNAEKKLKHNLASDFGAKKAPLNPRNYVVPDFGADPEITYANDGLKWAQNSLGHKWTPT